MKRFILRSVLFLLPLALLMTLFEYVQRRAPHEFKYKAAFMDANAEKLEVLVFGPSHTHRINLHDIGRRAFNLSFSNQAVEWDYALWRKYRDRLTALQYAVLSLSCWFHENTADGLEAWRTPFYNIHYGLSSPLLDLQKRFIVANPKSAMKRMDVILRGNYDQMQPSCDSLGSSPTLLRNRPADWDGKSGQFMARRHSTYTPEKAAANRRILERMIKELTQRGVRILLITTPTRPAYYEHLTPDIVGRTRSLGKELECSYPGVRYLDLLEDSRFVEEDFMDDSHLNYDVGGRKLARLLHEYIAADSLTANRPASEKNSGRRPNGVSEHADTDPNRTNGRLPIAEAHMITN